jgi:hypothetical protein
MGVGAARQCPSDGFSHPWHGQAVTDSETEKRISALVKN